MKKLDALGVVETRGFVSVVEAANAMAQIADVELVHYEKVGDGLTSIVVRGPLEEVRRAVGAGMAAARRVGDLVAAQVLPRVHPKAEKVLPLGRQDRIGDEGDG
jgi:microcompartment protein CcmL/EutN